MTPGRRNLLIAAVTGLVVAGIITAIAATQFDSSSSTTRAKVAPLGSGGLNRLPAPNVPGLGGNNGGFQQQRPSGSGSMGILGGGRLLGGLTAVASYLGVTPEQLITEVANGKSLAQVAKEHGKSIDGLLSTMTGAVQKQLDEAVSAGVLTQAQADTAAAQLKQGLQAIVNGTMPRLGGLGLGALGGLGRLGGEFGGDRGGPRDSQSSGGGSGSFGHA